MKTNWRKYNGALISNLPPHKDVDASDIVSKIKESKVLFARWVSDFDCKKKLSFWYIIHDTPMKMNDYSANTRNQIKKGINNFQIKIIDKSVIEIEGYDIYASTFQSYNTFLELKSKEIFIRQLEGEWEFWGVYFESNLIGYSQNKVTNDYCEYSSIKIDLAYKKMYPSYALFFLMNNYYLNEKNLKYVNNGSRSVSHDTEIQSFLVQKFGFRKAYCKMHISYSPFVAVAIKFIYPFRFVVKRLNNNFANRLLVLIRHEEIRKSFL